MFRKPFKLKSQVQLKSSEKKKIGSEIIKFFSNFTEDDIKNMFNSKDDITKAKIITYNEEIVDVYYIEKIPMFFEVVDYKIKLPTVFCLWVYPNLVPKITTNSFVFEKLKNGADLFAPGVIVEGLQDNKPGFVKSDPVSLNLIENYSCHGVGVALSSQSDVMSALSGKTMKVCHTVGDFLYKQHPAPLVPQLGPPDWAIAGEDPVTSSEDVLADAVTKPDDSAQAQVQEETLSETDSTQITPVEVIALEVENLQIEEPEGTRHMDELLEYAFIKSIKTNSKTLFPILPATLYAQHILMNLPNNEKINIKATKWKKFSVFLEEMSAIGVITLEKIQKNEYKVIGANLGHVKIKSFVDVEGETKTVDVKLGTNGQPLVQQVYLVNANTLRFFERFGCKKKDELTKNEIRNFLNDYIKTNNLQDASLKDKVVLDPILYELIKREVVNRAELLTGLLEKMGVEYKISNTPAGGTITHKGKMPFIEFEIVTRSGNKKVTLINNLESYGVDISNFSKELQHEAAASTTVVPVVPGKKGAQVQVQGNQIHLVIRLLTEKHKINEKHMKGTEKAIKQRKK